MEKVKNQIKAGALLSYLQMALNIVIGLIYTPLMIRYLGQSEYGLYNTVASTISMLSILSLGFNSSYIRYYAKYKKDGNEDGIAKLNGLFLIIFAIIGVVALLCGTFLSFNLRIVFDKGLTSSEYQIAKVLMLLLTVNLALSFPMSVFSSIISAHEKYIFLKLLGMAKNVLGPLVTMPLLLMGYRSIAMVSVTVAVSVIVGLIKLTAYIVYRSKTDDLTIVCCCNSCYHITLLKPEVSFLSILGCDILCCFYNVCCICQRTLFINEIERVAGILFR